MTDPLPWLILLPLAWANLSFLAGPGRGARLAMTAIALQLVLSLMLAGEVSGGSVRLHAIGGWDAPLGIALVADGLCVMMLMMTQAVGLLLAVYARAYFAAHADGVRYFWPLTGLLMAGMNALFLSGDIFNLYVTLELVSLAAVGLVASHGGAQQVAAALRYLLTTLLGSGAYLSGVAIVYGAYGNVSIAKLAPMIDHSTPPAVMFAAGLMLLGLLLKTALFPFHFWLPPAHGGAPAPVSALLSALVLKATFYLIVRLWFALFPALATPAVAIFLGLLGTAAIVWGSILALLQIRLKMLIAYSTIAQIGYLFLLFPLVTDAPPGAVQSSLQGAMLQVLAHAMAKAAMFATAGAIIISTGSDDIAHLGGVSRRLPLTLFTFALAGVSLMGLPPSAGFLAKWLLIGGAIGSDQWPWIAVMIAGGLLSAAYVFKVVRHAFVRTEQSETFRPLPRMLEWPPFLLAFGSLALGVRATELLNLLVVP